MAGEHIMGFEPFGAHHFGIVLLTVAVSAGLPLFANRHLSERGRLILARTLATVISLTVVVWTVIRFSLGVFDLQLDLPLDICYSAALLCPFLLWKPKRGMHEVMYYLVLSGTLQAVLTPKLFDGFLHHNYIRYWIVHSGLVVFVIYVTAALKLYPTWPGMFRALAWLNVYMFACLIFNVIIGTNYMYVLQKPPTASLLDFFGPWPWYILVGEGVALVLFWISWLPVRLWAPRGK